MVSLRVHDFSDLKFHPPCFAAEKHISLPDRDAAGVTFFWSFQEFENESDVWFRTMVREVYFDGKGTKLRNYLASIFRRFYSIGDIGENLRSARIAFIPKLVQTSHTLFMKINQYLIRFC